MIDRPNTNADVGPLGIGSDAAQRIRDAYWLHMTADPLGNEGRWLAFRLSDGYVDATVYDTKQDAMRAKTLFAKHYGYMKLLPTGCSVTDAESYLRTCRQVAENPSVRWRNDDYEAPTSLTDGLLAPMRREQRR